MKILPEEIPPGAQNKTWDVLMKYIKITIEQCAEVIPGVLEQKGSVSECCIYDAVLPNQITSAGLLCEYGKVQLSISHI